MARKSVIPKTNLFMTFREVTTADGRPFSDVLRWLNDQTGMATTNSRYGQYERGVLKPSTGSLNLILSVVLESKLQAAGLEPDVINEIVAFCHIPDKTKTKKIRKKQVKKRNTSS